MVIAEEIIRLCKKCPFCLSTADIFEEEWSADHENDYGITCSNCGCRTLGGSWKKLKEKVKVWNKRAEIKKAREDGYEEGYSDGLLEGAESRS